MCVAVAQHRAVAALAIAALLTGAASTGIRELALTHNFIARNLTSKSFVHFEATVKTDPVWGATKVVGSRTKAPSQSMLVSIYRITINGTTRNLRLPMRIVSRSALAVVPSEKISGDGTLFASNERRVAGLIAVRGSVRIVRGPTLIMHWTTAIRTRFRAEAQRIVGAGGALIPGLVEGDTSLEKSSFVTDMRRSGLTHLTAVSGENFAIVAAFMMWLTQWFIRRQRLRIVCTALVLIGFIFLVRPSPSVMRATVMTAVMLISRVRGVRSSALPSLGFAIALLIVMDPFQAIDPGFALSVMATAGILILSPPIAQTLGRWIHHPRLVELISLPVSATILCTPVIVAISGQLSLISIPANMLVTLVVAPVTVVGFVAALLPWTGLAHLLLVVINPISQWVAIVAEHCARFPVVLLPKSFVGALLAIVLILLIRFKYWKTIGISIAGLMIVLTVVGSSWPGARWLIVNCDVGQGDGLVINLGNHSGIVIDAGPDPVLMDKCLRSLGIDTVPLIVLSHYHADHVTGLPAVLAGRRIGAVWVTNLDQPATEYMMTMRALGLIHPTVVHQGEVASFPSLYGRVVIRVLWPQVTQDHFASLPGDGSGINNSSIALEITIGRVRLFAGGDIEPPAQAAIVESGLVHSVDILKVAHHGSGYQDNDLLDLLKPRVALISVGLGNPYGHPASSTIAALMARGVRVYRTDRDGAISVDASLRIRTKKKAWWNIAWG
jgi:competence protein ComEC